MSRGPSAGAGGGPKVRASDVLRRGFTALASSRSLTPAQSRVVSAIRRCRTAALGGHACSCPACGHEQAHFNSCRNRHCPQCQAIDQLRWFEQRQGVLLPVGHHHVVFTLPAQLRALSREHPTVLFDVLFEAARHALDVTTAEHLGGKVGVTALLHTWTRELLFHPHVHCIVTAGAWNGERWVHRKRWLVPGRQLAAAFRGRCLHLLHRRWQELGLDEEAWDTLLRALPPKRRWVVFCEPPLTDRPALVRYLANYTHRIAISDHRLLHAADGRVTFRGTAGRTCTLDEQEFARRFLMHVLPTGFRKIRHYGLYAPGVAKTAREAARAALLAEPAIGAAVARREQRQRSDEAWAALLSDQPTDRSRCPRCGGSLTTRLLLPAARDGPAP